MSFFLRTATNRSLEGAVSLLLPGMLLVWGTVLNVQVWRVLPVPLILPARVGWLVLGALLVLVSILVVGALLVLGALLLLAATLVLVELLVMMALFVLRCVYRARSFTLIYITRTTGATRTAAVNRTCYVIRTQDVICTRGVTLCRRPAYSVIFNTTWCTCRGWFRNNRVCWPIWCRA